MLDILFLPVPRCSTPTESQAWTFLCPPSFSLPFLAGSEVTDCFLGPMMVPLFVWFSQFVEFCPIPESLTGMDAEVVGSSVLWFSITVVLWFFGSGNLNTSRWEGAMGLHTGTGTLTLHYILCSASKSDGFSRSSILQPNRCISNGGFIDFWWREDVTKKPEIIVISRVSNNQTK